MKSTLNDLRLAVRGLRRSPLFATVAILSLALGIGANTAIFTLIDQILLRKLPVSDPDRAGDALPAGPAQRQQHGHADALVSDLSGLPAAGRAAGRGAVPPADPGLGQRRQPDRARGGRNGLRQLLLDARREAGRRTRLQLAGRRSGLSGTSGRRAQLRLLGESLRPRSRRRRQEDPRQRLPDDDRRRVGGGLRRDSIRRGRRRFACPS